MIGVLSLDPEGTILAARVTPDRDDLVGKRLSSVWDHESMSTHALLGVAMSGAGLSINVTLHDADGFPLDRTVTFKQTGRSDAPFWAVVTAHTSPDRDVPSTKATSTIGATDGARSADESGVLDMEKTDSSNAASDFTSPSSRLGVRLLSNGSEDAADAPGAPGCRVECEPGNTSSHDATRARSTEIQLNNPATHSGGSISLLVDKWAQHLHARHHSDQEIRRKRNDVLRFARIAGWEYASQITRAVINDVLDQMTVSSKTMINRIDRLKVFCDYCVERGHLDSNPVTSIRKPKHVAGDGSRALSKDEVTRLLLAVRRCQDGRTKQDRVPYYIIAAMTGLRVEECRRLKWKHVHLDKEKPYLSLDGHVTKNRKACDLPITGPAIGAFASIMPPAVDPETSVFETVPTRDTFTKDLERAGIAKQDERGRAASLHSLRKHLATALIEGGADIYTTKTMMRHSSIAITEKSYIDAKVQKVADAASSALSDEILDDWDDDYEDEEQEPSDSHTIDINTALDAWVGTLRVESTSVKETQNKRRAIEFFIDECGWESPSDATAQSIEAGKRAMVGRSSKTIRNKLSRLHVFLDFCVIQGWLESNAAKLVKPPKLVKGEGVRALSTDEILRLLAAIPPEKMYRFHYYAIAAWTGLRLSECKGLKWKDVVLDADEPYIELPAALAKSRKSQTVPVVNEALPHFNALRTDHPSPDDRVFDIVPELRTFNRDLARAGIPKHDERGRSAGIHSLRKHLGSALAKAGADIYTVQQMMRHADINTTRNIYIDDRLLDLGNKAREALSRQGEREARVEFGDAAEAGEAEAFRLRLAEG